MVSSIQASSEASTVSIGVPSDPRIWMCKLWPELPSTTAIFVPPGDHVAASTDSVPESRIVF